MKFLVVLIPMSGLIAFISCDQSIASAELSNQALKEISPYSDLSSTQPLPSGRNTVENIYYYYPVQPTENESSSSDRSDIEPESPGLYKRRRINRRRGKGNRKHRRKFEETGPKAERRAALRRTAAAIQSVIIFQINWYGHLWLPLIYFLFLLVCQHSFSLRLCGTSAFHLHSHLVFLFPQCKLRLYRMVRQGLQRR